MKNSIRWECDCGHISYESAENSGGRVVCEFCNKPMYSSPTPPLHPIPAQPAPNPPKPDPSRSEPVHVKPMHVEPLHVEPIHVPPHSPSAQTRHAAIPPRPAPRQSNGCLIGLILTGIFIGTIAFIVYQVKQTFDQAMNQVAGWVNLIDGVKELGNVDEVIKEYEQKGYRKIMGQASRVRDPIYEKRLYVAQAITIDADVHDDIAFLGQMVSIRGTVDGDLDFMGQVLEIERSAVIKGNVNVKLGQLVRVKGIVEGKLTGAYQALDASPDRIVGGTLTSKEIVSAMKKQFGDRSGKSDSARGIDSSLLEAFDHSTRKHVATLLKGRHYSVGRKAFEALAAQPPEDEKAKLALGDILLTKYRDDIERDLVFNVLEKVAMPEHATKIATQLKANPRGNRDLLELLLKLDKPESLIGLVNLDVSDVADPAWNAVKDNKKLHKRLAIRCLQDASSIANHRIDDDLAAEHLIELEITDEEVQTEIIRQAMKWSIIKQRTKNAIFRKFLNEKTVKVFLKSPPNLWVDRDMADIVASVKTPAVYAFLVEQFFEKRVMHFEKAIGETPECESYLWPYLRGRSVSHKRKAAMLLGKMGTPKSIPYLQRELFEITNKTQAQWALSKIRERFPDAEPEDETNEK